MIVIVILVVLPVPVIVILAVVVVVVMGPWHKVGIDLSSRHGKSLRHCRVLRHRSCDVAGAGRGVVAPASSCVAGRPLVGSSHILGLVHAE